jgi:hypothetical protein
MTDIREQRAKEIQDAIREVLYRDWDPIGVCDAGPADEYDSYIAPIYRLLVSKPNKKDVAAELGKLEAGPIGVGPAKEEALLPVAEKLLAIDVRLNR